MSEAVFLFITSWAQSTPYRAACNGFLELICRYLKPCEPAMTASLPGKMNWDTLTVRDRQAHDTSFAENRRAFRRNLIRKGFSGATSGIEPFADVLEKAWTAGC